MTRCHRIVLILCLGVGLGMPAGAEIVAVEQIEKGFTIRSEPTLTLVRESPKARAVLVLIPGGEGRIGRGLQLGQPEPPVRSSIGRAFDMLRDPAQTSGSVHVVYFDSPYDLPARATLPQRSARDHIVRIESVVRFYRDRYKLPVFLMGHSNGGYSIAEFHRHLLDEKKEDLIAGLISSASREISRFSSEANLPTLFLIPEGDLCHSTSPAINERHYQKFKAGNKAVTELAFVRGASEQGGDPCSSGTHMYNGAHEGLAKALDDFLVRQMR